MVNGIVLESNVGTSQGGPLSLLLSNIVLNEDDKELEKHGHPFVCYADDCVIFCKTPRLAERVKESITNFIEKKLHLKVNREKTVACSVRDIKFLGHSFYKASGVV
jgi:retron-type reverse transcriptase